MVEDTVLCKFITYFVYLNLIGYRFDSGNLKIDNDSKEMFVMPILIKNYSSEHVQNDN